jgi:hypothetical protein
VRIVVGDVGASVLEQPDELDARAISRVSEMPGLYATPMTRIFEPESDRWRAWFSAWETIDRQKYGIDSLTFPASSMNSVENPNSRAFHVR